MCRGKAAVRCCGGVRAVVRGEGRSKKQLYRALRPRVQKERENGRKTKTRKKKLWLSPRFLLLKFCNTPQASFDILRAVGKGEALAAAPSHQLLANMGVVMRTCAARSRLGGGGGPVAALLTVAVYALALALVAMSPPWSRLPTRARRRSSAWTTPACARTSSRRTPRVRTRCPPL
jgi:hypothetical protein